MYQGLNDLRISPKFTMETALKIEKKDKVLFLGEGNFSFSKSVVELQKKDAKFWEENGKNIYATCYQMEEEDRTELRDQNISYLKQRRVNILFKVDGRKLNTHNVIKNIQFTKIVFMFPHVGGKMKINLNRDLLMAIFESAHQVLDNTGTLLITLCAGQGGSPFETKIRRNDDTWKILEISQDAGFVLSHILNFEPQLFAEYCQVGYRSQQKGFNVEDSVVHIFKYKPLPELQPLHSMQDQTNYYALKQSTGGVHQLYPLAHEHHLSFWCRHNRLLSKEQLLEVARQCLGDIIYSINLSDEYKNSDGDISQTIIVTYKSVKFPLGPKHAFHLHYKVLGKSVCNIFRVELR